MKIKLHEPIFVRAKGISYGRWNTLVTTKVTVDKDDRDQQEVLDDLESYIDQLTDMVNRAYLENKNGYVQLGNTSIQILRFDAIQFVYVQNEQEVDLEL